MHGGCFICYSAPDVSTAACVTASASAKAKVRSDELVAELCSWYSACAACVVLSL